MIPLFQIFDFPIIFFITIFSIFIFSTFFQKKNKDVHTQPITSSSLNDDEEIFHKTHKTGIVYDKRMCLHHDKYTRIPEIPLRITRIYDKLQKNHMIKKCIEIDSKREVDISTIQLCHSEEYVKRFEKGKLKSVIGDYYVCEKTFLAASVSLGCCLNMVDEILCKKCDNGFCINRPPGHHALKSSPKGFCFFSNVTIAAKYAKKKYGIKKVLIIDWDVHHGNGTQDLRMDDKNILFISIHRNFYPYTGYINNIGKNGNTINICYDAGYGDIDILQAFYQIVLPVSCEFNPEMIIVSAGFDACRNDPLGSCTVTPSTFGLLTHLLMGVNGGKNLMLCLEGGYNLSQIEICAVECIKVLLGHTPQKVDFKYGTKMSNTNSRNLYDVMKIHSKYWNCLKHIQDKDEPTEQKKTIEKPAKEKEGKKEEKNKQENDDMEFLNKFFDTLEKDRNVNDVLLKYSTGKKKWKKKKLDKKNDKDERSEELFIEKK